jgi:hypothetical protein
VQYVFIFFTFSLDIFLPILSYKYLFFKTDVPFWWQLACGMNKYYFHDVPALPGRSTYQGPSNPLETPYQGLSNTKAVPKWNRRAIRAAYTYPSWFYLVPAVVWFILNLRSGWASSADELQGK